MSGLDYLSSKSTVHQEAWNLLLKYVEENKQLSDGDGGFKPTLVNNISPFNAKRMLG